MVTQNPDMKKLRFRLTISTWDRKMSTCFFSPTVTDRDRPCDQEARTQERLEEKRVTRKHSAVENMILAFKEVLGKMFSFFQPTKIMAWDFTGINKFWVVVSNIFYFHPYLGEWSNLTNIFQMGCFHQLELMVILKYEKELDDPAWRIIPGLGSVVDNHGVVFVPKTWGC